ncbi:multifunctional CCA addition/repair protein [Pseudomonas massiliensis]|uniref:multifunctional CCA addition/repair protein n=1 Tax=Pseudomonas massiliensis TaxID=522492 RepID=UPI00058B6907|nr:multifunctional CCA addition/repair protein [Pseudomonas massiliensis]
MKVYKVGGAVRDRLLGLPVADIDWVVVGASAQQMHALGYRPVGADFPVFLHPRTGAEYALARTERKSGRGYGGFVFHASPDVTLEEDLRRRDLTINAMAEDDSGHVIDPYGGQRDLAERWLRHVSPSFAEDPLRVLRVARFAARYAGLGFRIAPETLALMTQLSESGELQALTPERSWKEISRALMEARPTVFFETLRACGALKVLFPELQALFERSARTPAAVVDLGQWSIACLAQAACAEHPLAIRWASLLLPLSYAGDSSSAKGEVSDIQAVSLRFKVPRDCQELAQLSGRYHALASQARALPTQALFDLLQAFDIYRRPQRFAEFIDTCENAALCIGQETFEPGAFLRDAAATARDVAVKPLLEAGLTGQALGEALKKARLAALEAYRAEP